MEDMDDYDKVMEVAEGLDTDELLDALGKAMNYMTDKQLKSFLRYIRNL